MGPKSLGCLPLPISPLELSWKEGKGGCEGDSHTLQVRGPVLGTTGMGSRVLELGPGRCSQRLRALTLALPLSRCPAQLEVEGCWGCAQVDRVAPQPPNEEGPVYKVGGEAWTQRGRGQSLALTSQEES